MVWLKEAGFLQDICWSEKRKRQCFLLPEWASFLIWLGSVNRGFESDGKRVVCVALLPTRICCSSLAAFGSITNSLTNSNDKLSWDLFLECEEGLLIYILYPDKKGRRKQFEGELGRVEDRGGQKLRNIRIISKRREYQNLSIQIGKSSFLDSNVSFHPYHRSRLLSELYDLSDFFNKTLHGFNDNRLLLRTPESVVVTSRAGWERENDELFFGIDKDLEPNLLPVKEVLLTRFSRTLLSSPKSNELQSIDCPLAILDGMDALRSREFINARNMLVLLDQYEYGEEAEDILTQFAAYCTKDEPNAFKNLRAKCPTGIEVQFYLFDL